MAGTMKNTKKPAVSRPKTSAAKASSAKVAVKPAAKPTAPPKLKVVAKTASADSAVALTADISAALLTLVKETPDAEGAAAIAQRAETLAKGEILSNAALRELKAGVNAVAAQLRAADKTTLARQWSRANRGVRRLERASRTAS